VASIETVDNPFRFPGQYYDSETGLHYNYFRYYNPQTGRYITPDPIGLEGGINLFAYVQGNPLRWMDPFGLDEINPSDVEIIHTYSGDFLGGIVDIIGGRNDMMDAATKRSDAYFHCRANCEASKRGQGGYDAARIMSWLREAFQNEAPEDRSKDEAANAQGQCAGKDNPDVDCYKACSNLIPPSGIPRRHLPPNAEPIHIYRPQR
jgi:RHS repeat-associated protein